MTTAEIDSEMAALRAVHGPISRRHAIELLRAPGQCLYKVRGENLSSTPAADAALGVRMSVREELARFGSVVLPPALPADEGDFFDDDEEEVQVLSDYQIEAMAAEEAEEEYHSVENWRESEMAYHEARLEALRDEGPPSSAGAAEGSAAGELGPEEADSTQT